ncbi:hypothetical protein COCON_G00061710, partial [Conger conger]
ETVCRARTSTNITPKKTVFIPGESAKIVCEPPSRTHTKKREDTVTCRNDGSWSFSIECEETICTITPEDNILYLSYWRYTFQYKQTLSSYTCRRGFKTSGGSTCEVEGWVPPLCPAITCNPEIPNAIILSENKTYTFDERLEYECKLFHEPEGKQYAYCGLNGWQWPNCKETVCRAGTLKNIIPQKTEFIPGESATIVCEPPSRTHTKKREDTVTCRNNGSWSFNINCEETICTITPEDNILYLSYWRYTFQYKQTLSSYTCRRGFKTSGGSTCEVEGWVPPLCPAITCNPEIPNAIILSENKTYTFDERLEYECKLFHEPEGKQYAYCG